MIHLKITDVGLVLINETNMLHRMGDVFVVEVTDVSPLDDGDVEVTFNIVDAY